jgi:hypothetical protein
VPRWLSLSIPLKERRPRGKRREGAGGRLDGGQHFSRGALYLMLQNRVYRGEILHQGTAYPGQHKAIIDQAAATPRSRGAAKPTPPISLKPGTRLVREWRGVTHMVLIHAAGFEWRGQRCPSLSVVAREITGARWSGPRFFGLRQRLAPAAVIRTEH